MRLILYLLSIAISTSGLKILVHSPRMAYSHMLYMGTVADILHDAGHDVTVLQPIVTTRAPGTGVQKAKVIEVEPDEGVKEVSKIMGAIGGKAFWDEMWSASMYQPQTVIKNGHFIRLMSEAALYNVYNQTKLLDQLKEEKFDVGITELFDFGGLAIFHELGLKTVVGTTTFLLTEPQAYALGIPLVPSYVPASQGVTGDSATLFERLVNLAFFYSSWQFQAVCADSTQKVMDEKYENAPKVWDMVGNLPLILTNTDPLLAFPQPTINKVLDLGGITVNEAKPLDEHWSQVLNRRPKTVLISFGSLAPSPTMPEQARRNFVRIFREHPDVTFIWKYDPADELVAGVENLVLTKWMPQSDILADPRLTLFISHAGLGSTHEIAARGVPTILVPLWADQRRNARMLERLGSAIFFMKSDLVVYDKLAAAMERGLNDKELHEKAHRVKQTLALRPFTQRESLIRHIELVAASGDVLKMSPAGRNLSFIVYYNLDIFAIVLSVLGLLLFVVFKIIARLCCGKRKVKAE